MSKATDNKLEDMSLEETFNTIEEIMSKLQDDDVELEESFALYKNGMEMLAHCREVIDDVEKKVLILSAEGDATEGEQ